MTEQQAQQQVADAGRRLLREDLVQRTWGNVSCRTGGDTFVITPSGLAYEHMTADDVVPYDMRDDSFTGARRPSSEKGVHTAAYRRFPDAGFVIHTHQTYASALGLAGFDQIRLTAEETAALGGLALAAYGLPGTKKLVRAVDRAMQQGAHTVLMAHHGTLVVGRDADEAFARVKLLEDVCKRACQGQPADAPGDAGLCALASRAREVYGHAQATAAPAAVAASCAPITAELDDMAQMIGRTLVSVPAEEGRVLSALKKHDAVLVRGLGALSRAATDGDAAALCQLAEKACVCALHARACGKNVRLSLFDTALMRRVYLTKYQKRIGG